MRVLVAPQEFKGSLASVEAADCIAEGVRRALPDAEIDPAPLADGGPGTVDALVRAADGRFSTARVEGPLGAPIDARWGRIGDGRDAVIEMAAAAGLSLLREGGLDPRRASTFGVGQLIWHALEAGVERILIGVGGSATNDGGAGMAAALGARLLDEAGAPLAPGGAPLARLSRIDPAGLDPRIAAARIQVLCDVRNPLLGPDGASAVYGPQKGADPACIAELDAALANYAGVIERDLGIRIAGLAGGGAAGGLAAGLAAFCGAELVGGFDAVAAAIDLAERIAQADLVITGEGRLDFQSAWGKATVGVAALADQAGTPCLAVVGSRSGEPAAAFAAVAEAAPAGMPIAEAMSRSAELVPAAAERAIADWRSRPAARRR